MKSDLNLKVFPRNAITEHMPSDEYEGIGFLFIDQDNRLELPIWGRLSEI